jgi:hypothetical protein
VFGNVIGTGLGTVFRFWAYKKWVFLHPDHPSVSSRPVDEDTRGRIPQPVGRA